MAAIYEQLPNNALYKMTVFKLSPKDYGSITNYKTPLRFVNATQTLVPGDSVYSNLHHFVL